MNGEPLAGVNMERLDLRGRSFKGTVELIDVSVGELLLAGTQLRDGFVVQNSHIGSIPGWEASAAVRVEGNLVLEEVEVDGDLDLSHLEVTGDLECERLTVKQPTTLRKTKVGGSLRMEGSCVACQAVFDGDFVARQLHCGQVGSDGSHAQRRSRLLAFDRPATGEVVGSGRGRRNLERSRHVTGGVAAALAMRALGPAVQLLRDSPVPG